MVANSFKFLTKLWLTVYATRWKFVNDEENCFAVIHPTAVKNRKKKLCKSLRVNVITYGSNLCEHFSSLSFYFLFSNLGFAYIYFLVLNRQVHFSYVWYFAKNEVIHINYERIIDFYYSFRWHNCVMNTVGNMVKVV